MELAYTDVLEGAEQVSEFDFEHVMSCRHLNTSIWSVEERLGLEIYIWKSLVC